MYARIDEIKSFANIPTETRPVIQCEYAHAMGNSNGNYKVRGPPNAFVSITACTRQQETYIGTRAGQHYPLDI